MKPETLKIDDVEYVRKDSMPKMELPKGDYAPWEIGADYHVETVTKYYTGTLILVTEQELCLANAAWVPRTGRYHQYIAGAKPSENEPIKGNMIIGRGSIIAATKRERTIMLGAF